MLSISIMLLLSLNINRLRLDLLFLMHAQPSERAENKMRQNDPTPLVGDIEKVNEKLSVGKPGRAGQQKSPCSTELATSSSESLQIKKHIIYYFRFFILI